MRKNQLSFTLESFLDQAHDGRQHIVRGYIDGNSALKVTRDFILMMHNIYAKDNISVEKFVKEALKDDDIFGRFNAELKDNSGNVITYGKEFSLDSQKK